VPYYQHAIIFSSQYTTDHPDSSVVINLSKSQLQTIVCQKIWPLWNRYRTAKRTDMHYA